MRPFKLIKIFLIVSALFMGGCAMRNDLVMVENTSVTPSNVRQVDMRVGITVPEANQIKTLVRGNYTETAPVGQHIRSLSKKFFPYAFSSAYIVQSGSFPDDIDALISANVQDYKSQSIQVAGGFGLKMQVEVSVKASVLNRSRMVVWETTVRSTKISRSVVSPVIPVEQLAGEALSEAMADCFRQINEEISLSQELTRYAASIKSGKQPDRYVQNSIAQNLMQTIAQTVPKGFLGVEIKALDQERQTQIMRIVSMNPRMRAFTGGGAEVVNVVAGSPADRAGIHTGDIIIDANGVPVTTPESLVDVVQKAGASSKLTIYVIRNNRPSYFDVVLGERQQSQTAAVQQEAKPASSEENLPAERTDTYAVVIGIDYADRNDVPALKYASKDAQDIYNILTDRRYGGVPKDNAILLTNQKATRNNIIAALRKVKTWDGYVYVYFTGHGAPVTEGDKVADAVIVPADTVISDPDSMADTAIRVSYIQNILDTSNAKGVMVALDACFTGSGKSITAKGGKPIVGMVVTSDIIKSKGTGRVIITSSAANQQSWEDDSEFKAGIFSHYFKEGLTGSAGKGVWVTIKDIAEYIKSNVAKAAFKIKGQEQEPQIIGNGDFAVTRNWAQSKLMDEEMGKNRLKSLFEKGLISADQLSRALAEMKKPVKSKLLEALLEGRLEGKNFGELY